MDKHELQFQLLSALSESRAVGPGEDPEIARRYADLLAGDSTTSSSVKRAAPSRVLMVEIASALLASLIGLIGVIYASRQFASATALYGFYPAGSHGRLVLAVLALFCIGLSAGAVLHALFAVRYGVPILAVSSVALILGAIFVATYTGPADMTLEYTQLIPSGAVAMLSVITAALAAIATVTALVHTSRPGSE